MLDAPGKTPLFAEVSKEELELLMNLSSREVTLEKDDFLSVQGDLAENFYLMVEGALLITRRVDLHELIVSTVRAEQEEAATCSAQEWRERAARHKLASTGEPVITCSVLLATPYIASAQALKPSRLLEIHADTYLEWVAGASPANSVIVPVLVQRVKTAETLLLQREKMAALGKMAAGLTHELNNPAAAASRSASQLSEVVANLKSALSGLIEQSLTPEQLDALTRLEAEVQGLAAERGRGGSHLHDPLAQSELEEVLADWMDRHGIDAAWNLAASLAEAGAGIAWLEDMAKAIPAKALEHSIVWAAASLNAGRLLEEIDRSTARISELVSAVKNYSYMDRAPGQEVDVHEGLEATLAILSHKLRGIEVTREYDRHLPRIRAYPGELNQVWTNLIDNAADALNGQGEIRVRTWQEDDSVMVEIADNGPGIPQEIQSRIFEPFFTTKPASKGMGLGLEISYRIVAGRHHGDIRVQSSPGDTRFQVCLPLDGVDSQ